VQIACNLHRGVIVVFTVNTEQKGKNSAMLYDWWFSEPVTAYRKKQKHGTEDFFHDDWILQPRCVDKQPFEVVDTGHSVFAVYTSDFLNQCSIFLNRMPFA